MAYRWAVAMTTVPERLANGETLRSYQSIVRSGFRTVHLLSVDGPLTEEAQRAIDSLDPAPQAVTVHRPPARTAGAWVLAAWELWIRTPGSTHLAIFQDDLRLCRNVRPYLERRPGPKDGYWNLYTYRTYEQLLRQESKDGPPRPGFHRPSLQRGLGAVALVFPADVLSRVLIAPHMRDRLRDSTRGWRSVDGAIVTAIRQAGLYEYVHWPSLAQHRSDLPSVTGNRRHEPSLSWPGEDWDALGNLAESAEAPEPNPDSTTGTENVPHVIIRNPIPLWTPGT